MCLIIGLNGNIITYVLNYLFSHVLVFFFLIYILIFYKKYYISNFIYIFNLFNLRCSYPVYTSNNTASFIICFIVLKQL